MSDLMNSSIYTYVCVFTEIELKVSLILYESQEINRLNILKYERVRNLRTPPTTQKPPGCHHNGRHYAPYEEINSGRSGNWCYGLMCGYDGYILAWDDWNCGPTTPPSTPPTPTPPGVK
ncbi:hypothetical protein MAR_023655 [Mya arenaria]|uniref:Uncharacterized protein n=1 Tax=Mya arenaria TaxID=6604 RepID=A0ABY7DNM6_MYAAR|nr:hypothetical protein MAR_023655 [Mya arenaria]